MSVSPADVRFEHTIVPARDKYRSARFFAGVFGLPDPVEAGFFLQVRLSDGRILCPISDNSICLSVLTCGETDWLRLAGCFSLSFSAPGGCSAGLCLGGSVPGCGLEGVELEAALPSAFRRAVECGSAPGCGASSGRGRERGAAVSAGKV